MGDDVIESLAELLWSPDSKAFAITSSDGGWVGTWSVVIYRFESGGLMKTDVTRQVSEDFRRRKARRNGSCVIEPGNIGAAACARLPAEIESRKAG